jgi:hypothetical protein
MQSKNPLDVLFQDLIREQSKLRRSPPEPAKPRVSTYANPDNWRLGKVVQIIHADGENIGVYQEYFHKSSLSTRRLLPANPAAPVDRSELVFGDHWLHPSFQSPLDPDSDAEVRALAARFNELMEDLETEEE